MDRGAGDQGIGSGYEKRPRIQGIAGLDPDRSTSVWVTFLWSFVLFESLEQSLYDPPTQASLQLQMVATGVHLVGGA